MHVQTVCADLLEPVAGGEDFAFIRGSVDKARQFFFLLVCVCLYLYPSNFCMYFYIGTNIHMKSSELFSSNFASSS